MNNVDIEKKPNVTVAAAITTHSFHSFLVFVGVRSSVCSPVIQTSICLLFYWTEYIYCIFTNNTCGGGDVFNWVIKMALSDLGEKWGCSKDFSFRR